ncbi:MAG: tetratricopeptide repeat protein [Fimbriimonadaceae bacterium]
MVRRSLVGLALYAAFASAAYGQTRQSTLDLIKRGDLKAALSSAKQASQAKGAIAADFQIEGILLVAEGRMAAALAAFDEGLKRSQRQNSATGLESLPHDSPLSQRLALVRGIFTISSGEAAFRNNIGLTSLILGKMKEGFDQLNAVNQLAPTFGAAYVNEAAGHLLKAEGSKTVAAGKRALDLGETSVMARTVLAEGYIIVNRLKDAGDQLQIALEQDPDNALALAAKAKLALAMGDARGAQRYRSQALAGGAPIAVDGALAPSHTLGSASGGSAHEDHYSLDQRTFQPAAGGLAVNFKGDNERVQNRSDAYQSLSNGGAEVANAVGALHFDYQDLSGGRPGTTFFEPGVTSDPTANVAFRQSNAYGNLKVGPILFHGGLRSSTTNLADAGNATTAHDADLQYSGEARYDLPKWGGKSTAGFAYTYLNRNLSNGLVIDPTEELLPAGRSSLWTGYFLHSRDLSPIVRLGIGGAIGRNGSAVVGEPYFNLTVHLGTKNVAHLGVSGLFNTDVGDLMPDEMRAPPVIDNPVDRNQDTTTPYNRSPVLLTEQGRQRTYILSLRSIVSPRLSLQSAAYHHELKDVTVQGTDPQTATFLNTNQLSSGSSTGVSETVAVETGHTSSIRAQAYVQHTAMQPAQQVYNANQPGVAAPLGLPYAPGFGLDLSFNLHGDDWTTTLVASTLGRRTVATAVPLPGGGLCCSYVQLVNPVTAWNLFVHKQAGQFNLFAAIYNVTKVSFYPGDPGRTTIVFGFQL